jgi:transposase
LKLGILPEGYIYPKEERPLRDLFRKRMMLVQQRTAHILAAQSLIERCLGVRPKAYDASLLTDPYHQAILDMHESMVRVLTEKIIAIEKTVKRAVTLRREFAGLVRLPGIGTILAMTIMLEVGDIGRFATPGQYASYCRCVRSIRSSNGRKKGEGNQKNGNKYLSWAYVQAVHCALNAYPAFTRYYERKKAATNGAVATKALCNKLARASYFVMRDQVPYDEEKLFREEKAERPYPKAEVG